MRVGSAIGLAYREQLGEGLSPYSSSSLRGIGPRYAAASLLILSVVCLFLRWISADDKKSLLLVAVLWLALTLLCEMGLGHFLFKRSWESLRSDFNLFHGGLLPIGLVALTLSPLIARTLR